MLHLTRSRVGASVTIHRTVNTFNKTRITEMQNGIDIEHKAVANLTDVGLKVVYLGVISIH